MEDIFTTGGLTKEDVARLQPHITGTNKLAEMLVLDQFTEDDLQKLIQIEVHLGQGRTTIIRKLIGRWQTKKRQRILQWAKEHKNAGKRN